MFKEIVILLSFYCFIFTTINAQEYVPDPGFESVVIKNKNKGETFYYQQWKDVSLPQPKYTLNGAPKYSVYHSRASKDKINEKTNEPAAGDGYLICIYAYFRNLYQCKLNKPLKKGQTYKVQFKYKVLHDKMPLAQVYNAVVGNLGCLFTTKDLSDSIGIKTLSNLKINLQPHIALDTFDVENNNKKWTDFEGYFTADRDYTYMIVGNFRKLLDQSELSYHIIKGITYRMDEVYVSLVEEDIGLKESKDKKTLSQNLEAADRAYREKIQAELQNMYQLLEVKLPYSKQEDSLAKYYKYVSDAEMAIIEGDYTKSLAAYCNAFDYTYPFLRDYINASRLVSKFHVLDSTLHSRLLATSNRIFTQANMHKKILQNLMNKDTVFHKSYVHSLMESPLLTQIKPNTKIDSTLINHIDSLTSLDRYVRLEDKTRIGIQDSLNYVAIKELYKKYPEISERTVGRKGMQNLYLMFLHISRYAYKDWIPIIKKETLKGHFDNRQFAALVDFYVKNIIRDEEGKSIYMTEMAYPVYTQYIIPIYNRQKMEAVNKQRSKMFLESLERQQIKQLYNFRNGYQMFNFYEYFTLLPPYAFQPDSEALLEKEKRMIAELKERFPKLLIYDIKGEDYDIE